MLKKAVYKTLNRLADLYESFILLRSEKGWFGYSTSNPEYSAIKLEDTYGFPVEPSNDEYGKVEHVALLGAPEIEKLKKSLKRELGIEETSIEFLKKDEINVQITPNKGNLVINGKVCLGFNNLASGSSVNAGEAIKPGSYEIYQVSIRLRGIDLQRAMHTKEKLANKEEKSFLKDRHILGRLFLLAKSVADIEEVAKAGERRYHDVDLTPRELERIESMPIKYSSHPNLLKKDGSQSPDK